MIPSKTFFAWVRRRCVGAVEHRLRPNARSDALEQRSGALESKVESVDAKAEAAQSTAASA